MKHPFEEVLEDDQGSGNSTVKLNEPATSRRGLLGLLLGILAGGSAVAAASRAEAQTTLAVGEEGGRGATTYAVGEEGGRVTTYAVGEEGGRYYHHHHHRHRRVTTYAVGEEGGYPPVRTRG